MKFLEKYRDFKVLITGATSGIGLELARLLSSYGFMLVLAGKNREKLEAVKEELSAGGSRIASVQADLADPDSADKVFDEISRMGIDIDVVINNAGVGLAGLNTGLDTENAKRLLALNVTTPTRFCILFAKKMAERKRGFICNVGSLIALFSVPFFSVYAASKAYIFNYTRALRSELAQHGVSVTCLLPGFTKTQFDENAKIKSEVYKDISRRMAMDPSKVAKSGIRAIFKKKAVFVPGLSNKAIYILSFILPKRIISFIMLRILKRIYGE